jgi:hypothetical protein
VQSRGVLTRRALLGLIGLSVAGCSKHAKAIPPKPAVVPDAAALASARASEQMLLDAYAAKIRAAPVHERAPLVVARAVHATHLAALHGTPAPLGTAATAGTIAVPLRSALRASATSLRRFSLVATDGGNAALFASIAASHETSLQ